MISTELLVSAVSWRTILVHVNHVNGSEVDPVFSVLQWLAKIQFKLHRSERHHEDLNWANVTRLLRISKIIAAIFLLRKSRKKVSELFLVWLVRAFMGSPGAVAFDQGPQFQISEIDSLFFSQQTTRS